MLTVSGVYAEDIDSSVVAESPVSAGVDKSLSSGSAFNNEISNSYEPSDFYESSDSYESLDVTPQIIDENSNYVQSNSNHLSGFSNMRVIDVNYDSCKCESLDVPDDVGYLSLDSLNCEELLDVPVVNVDSYVDCGPLSSSIIDVEVIELNSLKTVENNVILNNSNSYSDYILILCTMDILEEINIFEYLNQEIDENIGDTIISEVTFGIETSESYKLIRDVTQVDNLLNFENVDAVLAINVTSVLNSYASEPVFDILTVSECISKGEVYVGSISEKDMKKLLKSVGAEDTLFANSIANWYPVVTFEMLQKLANHGQILEDSFDGYTVTKALLQYDSLNNELYAYIINSDDNEDEYGHVINDTNSHGLDYAYAKHVIVNNKDMLNLIVLIGADVKKHTVPESNDNFNDVLGIEMSSETLLPDHKAIWTPILLLQLNLKEFNVTIHAGDNKNINKINGANNTDNNSTNHTNSSNHTHHHGHYHRHWGYYGGGSGYCSYITGNVVPTNASLDNSTNNKTNSSNVTSSDNKGKFYDSHKGDVKANEPTYTLVYAIIGIILLALLFNSSYMKRD